MYRKSVSICVVASSLALGCPAQAGKTAVIPCATSADGTIVHEKKDIENRAKQFAISNPKFYRINQFRKTEEMKASGITRGTCIIEFMSEDEFNSYN